MTPPPSADPDTPLSMGAGDLPRASTQRTWARVAGAVTALQGLALVGFMAFYGYEITLGAADDQARAVMSCVLFAVFAWALLAVARGWRRDLDWPRTPTIVWNALLLPVAWSMREADRLLIAGALGGTALLALVAAVAAGSRPERPATP